MAGAARLDSDQKRYGKKKAVATGRCCSSFSLSKQGRGSQECVWKQFAGASVLSLAAMFALFRLRRRAWSLGLTVCLLAVCALTLGGCGGGTTTPTPTPAALTAAEYLAQLRELAKSQGWSLDGTVRRALAVTRAVLQGNTDPRSKVYVYRNGKQYSMTLH
jgi:hypothetical protein